MEAALSGGIDKHLSCKGNYNCLFLASFTEGCSGSETRALSTGGVGGDPLLSTAVLLLGPCWALGGGHLGFGEMS